MKKIKLFFGILVGMMITFLSSCVKDADTTINNPDFGEKVTSTVVTPEMARTQLEDFLGKYEAQTRSGKTRTIANMQILGGFGATRTSESAEEEPLVYLFNFADDEGYSLVSGDTRIPDIMVFVESGNLDPEEGTDNPGLILFLENADTYYRAVTGLPIYDENNDLVIYNPDDPMNPIPLKDFEPKPLLPLDNTYYRYTAWSTWSSLGSVIPCQWDQTTPFNRYCFTNSGQQAYAGCVAIAVAQIMYKHGKNYSYNGEYFNWDLIRTVTRWNQGTDAAKDKAARLVYQLGRPQNLNMNYGAVGSNGSGAYGTNVPRTFRNFGYSNGGTYQSYDISGLTSDKPLYVDGYAKKKTVQHKFLGINTWKEISYHEGHAWVIDEKINQKREKKTYVNNVLTKTETEYRRLVHCNWGWGGSDNGYYFDKAFNTNIGPETTTRSKTYWEGISYYYRFQIKMASGIKP